MGVTAMDLGTAEVMVVSVEGCEAVDGDAVSAATGAVVGGDVPGLRDRNVEAIPAAEKLLSVEFLFRLISRHSNLDLRRFYSESLRGETKMSCGNVTVAR